MCSATGEPLPSAVASGQDTLKKPVLTNLLRSTHILGSAAMCQVQCWAESLTDKELTAQRTPT